MHTLAKELESTWHRDIPLAAALGVEVASYTDDELVVRAALAPNVNMHGTAFAGSLYSICALTGWGMIWLKLRDRALAGHIVLAEARIRYRRAVDESIVCRCRFDAALAQQSFEQLETTGRGFFPLACVIDADGRLAVRFDGEYAVKEAERADASA
jgi:thioesterase domain-containing protein